MKRKLIIIMQLWMRSSEWKQNSLVTKREENTRTHPEHGRKDS